MKTSAQKIHLLIPDETLTYFKTGYKVDKLLPDLYRKQFFSNLCIKPHLSISIISFFLILALVSICFAEDKKEVSDRFRKMMETAHPLPEARPEIRFLVPYIQESRLPIFLNVNMTNIETDLYRMQNESSIAVNPLNPQNLIASAVDYRNNSSAWIYVSHDGGKTWNNIDLGKPHAGWTSTNDPSVAFDPEGIGYFVYGGFGYRGDTTGSMFGENGVFLAKSTDEGNTWRAHIPIIVHRGQQSLDSTFEDKYYISVDCSPSSPFYKNLYVPWKRVTPKDSATQIVISKSTDGGETWSEPVPVSSRLTSSSEDTTYGQSFPLATMGPEGEVYVVWNHGIEHGVGFAKSADGGKTFSEPKIIQYYNIFGETRLLEGQGWRHSVKKLIRAETYPVIACDIYTDNKKGNLYLTWAGNTEPDIYFSYSTDKGETWSPQKIVHSEEKNDQFWQWLALDPKNGDLAIMYLDSRDDPDNIGVECYTSYSGDGGKTWTDRRISDISGDLRLNPFTGNSFAGDYSGCAFYGCRIYPSWIDMRSAVSNIYDSDIYTGLIDVRSPMPVDGFLAKTIPEIPTEISLTWNPPQSRVFGHPLSTEDFRYSLYRNDEFLIYVPSTENSYIDKELESFTKYKYEIFVEAGTVISPGRSDSAFAGGGRKPAAPVLLSLTGDENNEVKLFVQMPLVREDGETPLVNLSKIIIYRDSVQIGEFTVMSSDTGKIMVFNDSPVERGFYHYNVSVKDGSIPENESMRSTEKIVFTGKIENSMEERFDGIKLAKYLNAGGWNITDKFSHNSPNSLTESPEGNYRTLYTYALTLFPVAGSEAAQWELSFWHAVIVDKTDSVVVEYSPDGNDFSLISSFKIDDYAPWQDGTLNADDWKYEHYVFGNSSDTVFVRFRLKSNITRVNDGWYIDDITINPTETSVGDETEKASTMIYPNPANDYITVNGIKTGGRMILSNIFGEEVRAVAIPDGQKSFTMDISQIARGFYVIRSESGFGSSLVGKFVKVE